MAHLRLERKSDAVWGFWGAPVNQHRRDFYFAGDSPEFGARIERQETFDSCAIPICGL
jgi:hypothetical protein